MRYFNTEGLCVPDEHYMVRLDDRVKQIKERYVDRKKYFIINRGRQYGKTTTLWALEEYLRNDYIVFSLDFQLISDAGFADEQTFVKTFAGKMEELYTINKAFMKDLDADAFHLLVSLKNENHVLLDTLFGKISRVCAASKKPIVLIIDEVDSASNNQVFIDFLAQLRGYYLSRRIRPFFQSVILAGLYDIKNLKLKLRPEKDHQYNSPWNITADFDIDMSFSVQQITAMLDEYESDHHTGMNTASVADEIYQYTSGYPYLVSALCLIMDEKLPTAPRAMKTQSIWTKEGVAAAVNYILKEESIPLFDSMAKQLDTYEDLREMIKEIIYQGKRISFSALVKSVNLGVMFGFVKNDNSHIAISNRIFEMALLNMFITEESISSTAFHYGDRERNRFTEDGKLNMDLVLEKFVEYYNDIFGDNDEKFIEKYGRKFFLLYLKPIINGTGNYYLEAQTRDARRTDVIVDYLGEQFIIELKIWHGSEYNERGEEQLTGYLDYFHRKKGYLLSFNFNKHKEVGIKTISVGGKTIVEAVV